MLKNNHLQKIKELFDKGLPFIDKAFLSSSENAELQTKLLLTNQMKYVASIKILSKNGVKIADISEKPNQKEVLFKSNTTFEIVSYKTMGNTLNIILKEI